MRCKHCKLFDYNEVGEPCCYYCRLQMKRAGCFITTSTELLAVMCKNG